MRQVQQATTQYAPKNFTKDDYTGTCLAYMNYVGNYVSYYLNVEEAGDYNVILNVANGRAAFDF